MTTSTMATRRRVRAQTPKQAMTLSPELAHMLRLLAQIHAQLAVAPRAVRLGDALAGTA